MARRSQPNPNPEQSNIDWGTYIPPTTVDQAHDSGLDQYHQSPGGYGVDQQQAGITQEALAILEAINQRDVLDAKARQEAQVRYQLERLREAQQLNSQSMFGSRRPLPPPPGHGNDRQLPPGLAARTRQPLLPPAGMPGGLPELPPAPGMAPPPRQLGGRAPAAPQQDPKGRRRPKTPDQNKKAYFGGRLASTKEWFADLSTPRRAVYGAAAGILAVGAIAGFGKLPGSPNMSAAQLAKINQEYPAFKNDSLSCGAALAKVAFAGSMTMELKVNLNEPGHEAFLPIGAYMGTDLDVGVCGQPGKNGEAQVAAAYDGKKYTVDRSVLNLSAPGSAFASYKCPPGSNDVKRICINTPKGFFVDGKKATIATTETTKGSGLYKVTTEDSKEYTVTTAELGRINKLTSAPASGSKMSPEYTQYLTAIAATMKNEAMKALENPDICAPLQSTIDAAVSDEIITRNKAMSFKLPKEETVFKKNSKYAPMSTNFINDKANKAILDPTNPAHILDVGSFKPTCSSVKVSEGSPPAAATPTPSPSATPTK